MELKLQKADHEYYETLRFAPFPCETMRENIVPDSCGDIPPPHTHTSDY